MITQIDGLTGLERTPPIHPTQIRATIDNRPSKQKKRQDRGSCSR
jgi:hypothetical protein